MNEGTFHFKYAGFWIRTAASIIDEIIVTIGAMILAYFAMAVVYFVTRPEGTFAEAFTGTQIQFIQLAASLFLAVPYHIGFHWKQGATPGKRMLKIVVRDYQTGGKITFSQSVWRYSWQILSALPFGAGYLMAAFHPKKRALHEHLSGTVSLMVERTPKHVELSSQFEAT